MEPRLKSIEKPALPLGFPGIVLDSNDLAELSLKRAAGVEGGARGAIISNSRIAHDDNLRQLIDQLGYIGRAKIKQDLPKHPPVGGGVTGSTVLYFPPDESVSQLARETKLGELGAVLNFYTQFGSMIESATITPNMSTSHRLKGVEIQFNKKTDKWWQIAGRMSWSFERGVVVATLPIDINEFLDRSDVISAEMFKIASVAYSSDADALQRVNIGITPDNHVILELGAGLSRNESQWFRRQLMLSSKSSEVTCEMERLRQAMKKRRIDMAISLAGAVGINTAGMEILGQSAYTTLNIESLTMSSGIVQTESDPNSCNPMNNGSGGIILLDQYEFPKIPAGLPVFDESAYSGHPPRNISAKLSTSQKVGMPTLSNMALQFANSITPLLHAEILCSPFHKDYRVKKE